MRKKIKFQKILYFYNREWVYENAMHNKPLGGIACKSRPSFSIDPTDLAHIYTVDSPNKVRKTPNIQPKPMGRSGDIGATSMRGSGIFDAFYRATLFSEFSFSQQQ